MTAYTANLDTFGLSRADLVFNSLAEVDGVLVGLDGTGAFALDAAQDDGADFASFIETGWLNFAGTVDPNIPTDTEKRLRAVYLTGLAGASLALTTKSGYGDEDAADNMESLSTTEAGAAPVRVVPPQGMTAQWWRFRLDSAGGTAWRVSSWRVVWELLSRRR